MTETIYDAVVVGGGPSGATIATDLAREGHRVLLLDRAGRIKPCGGAVPPRLLKDFEIPQHLLVMNGRASQCAAQCIPRAELQVQPMCSPSSAGRSFPGELSLIYEAGAVLYAIVSRSLPTHAPKRCVGGPSDRRHPRRRQQG